MKKFYKYLGIISIMVFSFYYTEKIASFMQSKNSLYQEIEEYSIDNNVMSVNAEIEGDYIIPGINGLSINVKKSYKALKSFGAFNYYYLVFDQVKPDLSLEDNKEKIIKQGNIAKKSVSLILEYNETNIQYLINNNIEFSVVVDNDTYNENANYNQINKDNIKISDICFVEVTKYEECVKNKKYIVDKNITLNGSNIASIKSSITNGDIIYIQASSKTSDLDILVKQVKNQGLNIIYTDTLISEEND